MDDLTQYVYANYSALLTRQENNAFADIYKEVQAQAPFASGGAIMNWIFAGEQVEVQVSVSHEQEAFMVTAREHVLSEHASEVVLNRCPRCGSLARTPKAKQCMKCFFDWHGSV